METKICVCLNKHCKHYKSDFDRFLEKSNEQLENAVVELLKLLNENVLIGEENEFGKKRYHNTIKDLDAIVEIRGRWDREDLMEILKTLFKDMDGST